jgi:uncharacterized membrane protein YgcG
MKRLVLLLLPAFLILTACEGDDPNANIISEDDLNSILDYTEPALPIVDSTQLVNMGGDTVDQIENNFPMPNGWVNDYDLLFSPQEKDSLANIIEQHFLNSGDEIYVVTVPKFDPYPDLTSYTVALGNSWKTHQDTSINNILIVLSVPFQEVRIESADAVGSHFTDEKSDQIIFAFMMPKFATGDFYGGIFSGVKETITYLESE